VKRFYLLSDYRDKGCGKKLLEKAIQTAPRFGFKRLRLDTTSRSAAAIHLFQKYGFKEITRYNDNPRAEFFFELILP
jgi:ribosomal protein S18 acetylase RimI-like enzyme